MVKCVVDWGFFPDRCRNRLKEITESQNNANQNRNRRDSSVKWPHSGGDSGGGAGGDGSLAMGETGRH